MNVSAWSIRNPIPALLLFVLLTLGGLMGFSGMKIQNFPDIDLPTVTVSASLPGASPAQLETVKSYLFAIVRNLYVQNWRIEKREAPLTDSAAPDQSVEQAIDAKAELARVLAALAQLDPLERAALLLRSDHQLAYDDIARLLEIPAVSARVKVHRARQKLMQVRKGTES